HQNEVDPKVTVTDQQVRDFYDQHREVFVTPPDARIRSIRIYLGQTKDDQDRAWARADAAYQKLAPGIGSQPIDFDAVANEYDETEKNPAEAGLGEWIRMGDDVLQNLPAHPLHDYLLNLPVGGVSRPFVFGNNLYIVKILERTPPAPLEFDKVKEHLRADLETQQHNQLDAELTARLMREANVTVYDQVIAKMLETDQATPPAP
ncbi:MAG TPA: peptidylprolyl isomerase, partial [Anaerolineae bacterium]